MSSHKNGVSAFERTNKSYRPSDKEPFMEERKPDNGEAGSEKDRRNANIVLLLFFVVLIGGGVWLVNALLEQRAMDNCLAQGRRNCAPVAAPAR